MGIKTETKSEPTKHIHLTLERQKFEERKPLTKEEQAEIVTAGDLQHQWAKMEEILIKRMEEKLDAIDWSHKAKVRGES